MKNQLDQNVLAFKKSSLVELNDTNLRNINSGGLTITITTAICVIAVGVVVVGLWLAD